MSITVTTNGYINFAPATLQEEVVQNVRVILGILQGEVPLKRDFGISRVSIDQPNPLAEARLTSEIMSAIKRYEPRAIIEQVKFRRNDALGQLFPEVVISLA